MSETSLRLVPPITDAGPGAVVSPGPLPEPAGETVDGDATTRERVLHLVVARGPIAAGALAGALHLTAPAVRRHLGALESDGQIVARDAPGAGKRGRGRPARCYVATERAHESLSASYSDLAVQALRYLEQVAGDGAVGAFAEARYRDFEGRYAPVVAAAGPDMTDRVEALARALADDGYEATSRPVPGAVSIQLCQGHCPVRHAAAAFPELCEAETRAFSRLLGVHVQRLATLAGGGHVCTTSIPTTHILPTPAVPPTPVEGQR